MNSWVYGVQNALYYEKYDETRLRKTFFNFLQFFEVIQATNCQTFYLSLVQNSRNTAVTLKLDVKCKFAEKIFLPSVLINFDQLNRLGLTRIY